MAIRELYTTDYTAAALNITFQDIAGKKIDTTATDSRPDSHLCV